MKPVQRIPTRTRSASPISRRPSVEDAEHPASRRIQGLPPEFGLRPQKTNQSTKPTMDPQSSQTPTAAPVVYLPVAPRTPTSFHGEIYEDVEDWLQHYERVVLHNQWTPERRLQNVYFSLEGTARHWFENRETSITSRDQLKPYRKIRYNFSLSGLWNRKFLSGNWKSRLQTKEYFLKS